MVFSFLTLIINSIINIREKNIISILQESSQKLPTLMYYFKMWKDEVYELKKWMWMESLPYK